MTETRDLPPIILGVEQDLDRDGYQDEKGTEHYSDLVTTPYGPLGNLVVKFDADDQPYVVSAPEVCLVKRGFPDNWKPWFRKGVLIDTNAFGLTFMTLNATNCRVRYQVLPNRLEWSDGLTETPRQWPYAHVRALDDYQLGVRTTVSWKRELQ